MTEEQIKQNAERFASVYYHPYDSENNPQYLTVSEDSFIAGAHSRDEEIELLRKALSPAQQAMEELTRMTNNPWISVEDEKPAEEKDVIFMLPDGLVYRGFRKVIGIRDRVFLRGVPKGTNCYMISDVSYWMAIPELKKGK